MSATYQVNMAARYVSGSKSASNARLAGLKPKSEYLSTWDKVFKVARRDVALDTINLKIQAYSLPDGILNISERMDALASRIRADFNEAFGRMRALVTGLVAVYGISNQTNQPNRQIPKLPDLQKGSTLDLSIAWIRSVHNALIKVRRYDQKVLVPIGLKARLGNQGFATGLAQGKWTIILAETDFGNARFLRLRGVGLSSDVLSTTLAQILPPTSAFQTDARPISGRITQGLSPTGIDIVGSELVNNMSPIGQWTITLDVLSAHSLQQANPKEVFLLLSVLTQPNGG
jgi:hypothetical protein